MRVTIRVELVTEQSSRLRRCVQVQVVIVVTDINAGRQRIIVSGRIFAVLLWTHGTVAWTQTQEEEEFGVRESEGV